MPNTNQPVVIITGASGFLGSALVDHFLSRKWQVVALVRNPKSQKKRAGVHYVQYDLQEAVDETSFKGATYLVHTAFIKYDATHPEALQLNVQAAKNLLAASRANKLHKNIFISSMSSHQEALSIYGQQKLAIEKLFSTKSDLSLRPGLIVGNGGIVKTMAEFMRSKHVVPLIAGGMQPVQVIAAYDLVQAVEVGLTTSLHGVLTVANTHVLTYRQFYTALKNYLHTWVIFLPVPFSLLYGSMRLVSLLHLPVSINEDNLLGLKKLQSTDTQNDLKKLHITPDDLEVILTKTTIS